jgi:hypothetical protein
LLRGMKFSMVGMGRERSACSGLRRSGRRCLLSPDEGGESSGDYKKEDMSDLEWVIKVKGRGCAREARRGCRCSIACASVLAGLMRLPLAMVRHPRLALGEAAACTAAAGEGVRTMGMMAMQVAWQPGLMARVEQCFAGVVDPGRAVVSGAKR